MKNQLLLLSLAAAALLAGCSKNEPDTPANTPATEISAKAVGAGSIDTKAPVTGTSLNGQTADVYSASEDLDSPADRTTMFTDAYARGTMTFDDVQYVGYDPGFKGKSLLPTDGTALYLYGFYPIGWGRTAGGTYESLTFAFDGHHDVMGTWLTPADNLTVTYNAAPAPDRADFIFKHLLTRYNIKVKVNDADAEAAWGHVKSVTIKESTVVNRVTFAKKDGATLGVNYDNDGTNLTPSSFFKLAGTPDAPDYKDTKFAAADYATGFPLTTVYQNACYSMVAPTMVDATSAAEVTLIVKTVTAAAKEITTEVPVTLDQTKFASNGNSTRGYSITLALNFRVGVIQATAIVEEWKDYGTQYEDVDLPPLPLRLTDNEADSPFLISFKDKETPSGIIWGPDNFQIGITDPYDGKENTNKIMALGTASQYLAAQHCRQLGPEWNLPAQAQLMLMWSYLSAIPAAGRPASGNNICSSTEDSADSGGVWCGDFRTGDMRTSGKRTDFAVRCVRDGAHPTYGSWKYPKVETGNTIVSRDAAGGIKSDALLTDTQKNWLMTTNTSTTIYNDNSDYNKVSAKFEVASTDASTSSTWADAYTLCKSYSQPGAAAGSWRLPTQRELMLMWMFKSQLTGFNTASGEFWSSTEHSFYNSHVWTVDFLHGDVSSLIKDNSGSVRCVRDRDILSSPAIGEVKDNGVVYYVNGSYYKVVSVTEWSGKAWAASTSYVIGSGAQSDTNGKANADAIKAAFDSGTAGIAITESTFEAAFPAAAACYNYKGKDGADAEGTWYVPAKSELQYLWCAYNGKAPISWAGGSNSAASADAAAQALFNQYLTNAGGSELPTSGSFWSSTEFSGDTSRTWSSSFSQAFSDNGGKNESSSVRCVRDGDILPPPAIGEVRNGGIVCWVNPLDPTDYKVVSHDQIITNFSSAHPNEIGVTAQSRTDGRANTTAIKNFAQANGWLLSEYGSVFFCDAKGDGWYMPAIEELIELHTQLTVINAWLQTNGGTPLSGSYFSNTEDNTLTSSILELDITSGTTASYPKTDTPMSATRCIRRSK